MFELCDTDSSSPRLGELKPIAELQAELAHVFPRQGSIDWELRMHRREYVEAGALFEIGGRLMAHPPTFEKVALAIGRRKVAERAGINSQPA